GTGVPRVEQRVEVVLVLGEEEDHAAGAAALGGQHPLAVLGPDGLESEDGPVEVEALADVAHRQGDVRDPGHLGHGHLSSARGRPTHPGWEQRKHVERHYAASPPASSLLTAL